MAAANHLCPFRRISPGSRLLLESGSAGPARRPVSPCAGVPAGPEPAGRDPGVAPCSPRTAPCFGTAPCFLRTAAGPRDRTAAPAQPAARSVGRCLLDHPAQPPRGYAGAVARQRPQPWSRRPSPAQGTLPPRPTGLTQTRCVPPPKLPTPPVPPSTPACVDRLWAGTRHRYADWERNRLAEDSVTFPDERSCSRHVKPENVQLSGSRRPGFSKETWLSQAPESRRPSCGSPGAARLHRPREGLAALPVVPELAKARGRRGQQHHTVRPGPGERAGDRRVQVGALLDARQAS